MQQITVRTALWTTLLVLGVGVPALRADDGALKDVVNRESGLAWRMPQSWQVVQASREGCLVNPGFATGQTLDVVVSLHAAPLEAAQQGVGVDQLLEQQLPDFRQELAGTGVRTRDPENPIERFPVGASQAARVSMRGETGQGRPAKVWLALRVDGGTALVCAAIFLDGLQAQYASRVQALFQTLRRANGAPQPEAEAPRTGSDVPPTSPKPQGNVVMTRRTLRDPRHKNMESHTLLAPKDWTVSGGAWWANPRYFGVLPSRDIKIQAPDGRRIHLAPSVLAKDFTPPPHLGMARPQEGVSDNGLPIIYMPLSLDEWRRWIETRVIPETYKGASDVRAANAVVVPELTVMLRRMMEPLRQMHEQQKPLDASMGLQSAFDASVLAIECSYTHDGRSWEELFILGVTFQGNESAELGRHIIWNLNPVVTYRAPAGELEANLPLLVAVANTVRVTPQWGNMRLDLQAKLLRIQRDGARKAHEAAMRRSRMLARAHSEISDIIHDGYREREAIRDATHRKVITSIHGTADYVLPGGSETIELPSYYDNVYTNGNDEYLLTNDHLYDPNTDPNLNTLPWETIKPVR